jgi:hypothetical protein
MTTTTIAGYQVPAQVTTLFFLGDGFLEKVKNIIRTDFHRLDKPTEPKKKGTHGNTTNNSKNHPPIKWQKDNSGYPSTTPPTTYLISSRYILRCLSADILHM